MTRGLLVDCCCGPCALLSLQRFHEPDYMTYYLFHNPNIHPFQEYRRRLEGFEVLMEREDMRYIVVPYDPEEWIRAVAYREESRCEICYRLRMRYAACIAVEEGYDALTTTLFASPYQDHDLITLLGVSKIGRAHV